MRTTLLTLSAAFLLASTGCMVGSLDPVGDTPDNPDNPDNPDEPIDEPNPDYNLLVAEPSAALTLGTSAEFQVTLTANEDFNGPVNLVVNGVPASWEAAFDSPTVVLAPDQTANATLTVVVPSNAEAATAELEILGSAAPGQRRGTASVAVENRLIVDIVDGTGEGQHPFDPVAEVRLGATVEFRNSDGSAHRIHAGDGDVGFGHQGDEMVQGQSYVVNITETGAYDYYCHIHEVGAGVGRITVIEAQ